MYVRYAGFLFLLVILGCSNQSKSPSDYNSPSALIESVPAVQPEKMVAFSEVDTLFLQHVGYNTIANNDGSFVLGDRQGGMILHIDSTGQLISRIARQGRGPGEVQDMTMTKTPAGGIAVYDQGNKKVLLFDADMEFEQEFSVRDPEGILIHRLYALQNAGKFIAESATSSWMSKGEDVRQMQLAHFNADSNAYRNTQRFSAVQYAYFEIAGGAAAGATEIPYTSKRAIRYNPEKETFWTMWTGTGQITEINAQYDTLRTVTVDLPKETLSSAEIDTLETQYQKPQWESLEKQLPDQKVAVDDMRVDEQGRFWLKLNYRSDYEQWLIADSSGIPQKIVQLSKDVMLTHVTKHHLGVRMGSGTFALFEPVE